MCEKYLSLPLRITSRIDANRLNFMTGEFDGLHLFMKLSGFYQKNLFLFCNSRNNDYLCSRIN